MSLKIIKAVTIFVIGGFAYGIIEILFRGYTHISMFVAGGISFSFMGIFNEFEKFRIPLLLQMLLSTIVITAVELITGLIVNVNMQLHVWDYSLMPLNFKGQICLPFSIIWFFLSGIGIYLEDKISMVLFHRYKFINRRLFEK